MQVGALGRANIVASALLEVARIAFSLLTPYLLQVRFLII